VSAFLVLTGALEGTLGECERVLPSVRQERGLAQPRNPERIAVHESRAVGFLQYLRKQRERLGNTPGQGIGVA
jgi:hypothetical protein